MNRKWLAVCVLAASVAAFSSLAQARSRAVPVTHSVAPALIPGTRAEMNTAGFWIGLHPFPDRIILDGPSIREMNAAIRNELKISYDISSFPASLPGAGVVGAMEQDLSSFRRGHLYSAGGKKLDAEAVRTVRANMNLESIPAEIRVQFGFVARSSPQRALPCAGGYYLSKSFQDFDRLQISVLDPGTPVAILHTSRDGRWHYATAPHGEGWVDSDAVSHCPVELLRKNLSRPGFIVVTAPKADIFTDPGLTAYRDRARMGTRLPLLKESRDSVEVLLPSRDKAGRCSFSSGFIRKKDVHNGYLPYTPRNILLQAFEFLNEPYGWGDLNGEQDCSTFIRNVFATVGIELPRNSLFQSRTGRPMELAGRGAAADKNSLLALKGVGGITLLRMKGHIMLYLGSANGVPYVIHAIWGYRQKDKRREVMRVVNRVVVTSLSLGKDTRAGSFLDRIDTARVMGR